MPFSRAFGITSAALPMTTPELAIHSSISENPEELVVVLTGATSGIGSHLIQFLLSVSSSSSVAVLIDNYRKSALAIPGSTPSFLQCLPTCLAGGDTTSEPPLASLRKKRGLINLRLIAVGKHPVSVPGVENIVVNLRENDFPRVVTRELKNRGLRQVNMLVHCAGAAEYASWTQQSVSGLENMLEVDLLAPILLTHAVLPLLRNATVFPPKVTVLSSSPSLRSSATATFCGLKAGLDEFAARLQTELRGSIAVQTLWVNPTATSMYTKMGIPEFNLGNGFCTAKDTAWQLLNFMFNSSGHCVDGFIGTVPSFLPSRSMKDFIADKDSLTPAEGFIATRAEPDFHRDSSREGNRPLAPHCMVTRGFGETGRCLLEMFKKKGFYTTGVDQSNKLLREQPVCHEGLECDLSSPDDIFMLADAVDRPIDVLVLVMEKHSVFPHSFERGDVLEFVKEVKGSIHGAITLLLELFKQQKVNRRTRVIWGMAEGRSGLPMAEAVARLAIQRFVECTQMMRGVDCMRLVVAHDGRLDTLEKMVWDAVMGKKPVLQSEGNSLKKWARRIVEAVGGNVELE